MEKRIEFYGDAVYNMTGTEMDKMYERCNGCNGGSTCRFNVWLASTYDESEDYTYVSWCVNKKLK